MSSFFKLVKERLKSETPVFFKDVKKKMKKMIIASGGLGLIIYQIETASPDFFPDIIVTAAQWISTVGVIGGFFGFGVASLPTTDVNLANKTIDDPK